MFASEYKALLTFRDLPARPNLAAIQYVQCTMHGHPYACYLADAQVVPSGSWGNDPRRGGLHSPILDVAIEIADRSDEAHAAAVRHTFLEALREQTATKRAVGVR